MYTSMWFMSILAILVVDVRTGALLQKDVEPRRCYQCSPGACQAGPGQPAPCPRGLHCATVAAAPDFTSTMTCAAAAARPCSLSYSSKTLKLTCTCAGQHCNGPFTEQLRNHLLNFTITNSTSDLTETLIKSFGNVSRTKLYDTITTKIEVNQSITPVQTSTQAIEHLNDINAPQAEALKHEATEPSDDEEDEGEGSGSYEDSRLRRPAAAPAAPSSYLPANENTAPPLLVNCILVTGTLLVTL